MKQLQFQRHNFLVILYISNFMIWYSTIFNHTVILQVMEFVESQEFNKFSRIVFDTAPTVNNYTHPDCFTGGFKCVRYCLLQGHTLRLLSLPDFLDASIGKMMKVLLQLHTQRVPRPKCYLIYFLNICERDTMFTDLLFSNYHKNSFQKFPAICWHDFL